MSVAILGVLALFLVSPPVTASDGIEPASNVQWIDDDVVSVVIDPDFMLTEVVDLFAADPLRLVAQATYLRRHSSGPDEYTVWLCDVPGDTDFVGPGLDGYVDFLNGPIRDWYVDISRGAYAPRFTAGGLVSADVYGFGFEETETTCVDEVAAAADVGYDAAFIIVDDDSPAYGEFLGGFAGVTACNETIDCPTIDVGYPGNLRFVVVKGENFAEVAQAPLDPTKFVNNAGNPIHEMGHVLFWPHSESAPDTGYDNPMDVMSGSPDVPVSDYVRIPYATIAFNRYVSGWIAPADVVVHSGGDMQMTLEPYDVDGDQMLVVPTATEGIFYTFGARAVGASDPLDPNYEGVEVYLVDWISEDCRVGGSICNAIARFQLQQPSSPNGYGHVLKVGDSITVSERTVTVTGRSGTGFTITVESGDNPPNPPPPPPPPPVDTFLDDNGSVFEADIEWMAAAGITKGCNPPVNDLFCPDSSVTRGQLAAFLVRALGLTVGLDNPFVDDDGSMFEADIEKLAAAGVTKGCNPPDNTLFCPDAKVTRGQMAAFLVRALGYTDNGGGDLFIDDDGSIFEADIDRLATAGVTKGCNPPTNDKFCPTGYVTRGQMAAFLHRALG